MFSVNTEAQTVEVRKHTAHHVLLLCLYMQAEHWPAISSTFLAEICFPSHERRMSDVAEALPSDSFSSLPLMYLLNVKQPKITLFFPGVQTLQNGMLGLQRRGRQH